MHPDAAFKACGGMTYRAIKRGWQMRRIGFSVHTGGAATVTSRARAIIDDAGMIVNRADKCCRGMTNAAILRGRHVRNRLAGGEETVVTRDAVIDNASVRECRRNESGSEVTDTAILRGWHMIGRLADRSVAVTSGTVTGNTGMIKLGAGESNRVVAHRTIFCSRDMRRIGLGILTDSTDAMTGIATRTLRQVGVVEDRRFKAATSDVTNVAILRSRNMRPIQLVRLANRYHAIMTGHTGFTGD